ncbi:MAG: ATP-binding protein [Candidatus Sedimenticola sp. 20ELBAFRAG]
MNSGIPAERQKLQDAFQVFNQVSEQLVDSYQQLELKVSRLSEELAAARSERMVELAEKERLANQLSKLLDTMPAAVIVTDGEARVQQFNPAAQQLFPDISCSQGWQELMDDAVAENNPTDEVRLKSGRLVTLTERSLQPESGRIHLLLDVTETRELQNRVERQQRLSAMGEMSAQLAHQIRTPLSSVLLYNSHLSRDDLTPEQRKRFSERSRTRLMHMERQINDMLSFARGECYTPEPVDLGLLLGDLRQTLAPLYEHRSADAQLIIEIESVPRISGNKDALLGAFANLAINAMEHGGKDVRLVIRLYQLDHRVMVRFEDNGPGIPLEIRNRIYDPFYTTRSDGTGLGLAVVQSVVLGHQGEISVNTCRGGGTCFVLSFPELEHDYADTSASLRSAL